MTIGKRQAPLGGAAVVALVGLLVWFLASRGETEPAALKLATTTSTENSGLLDHLLPAFTERTGIEVQVIAVGTGKAIKLAENGDVDVILVHAPDAEKAFVAAGYGVNRRPVMHNDFVLVGPEADPAGIAGTTDVCAALTGIAERRAAFVSRGDDSGTHKKELKLWAAAGIEPAGDWYMASGQGMGHTLTIAHEKRAYTLADRGTYVALREKLDLVLVCQGDPRLHNPYAVIEVDPARHPHVNHAAAARFGEWLVSEEARRLIAAYRRDGEQLFTPGVPEVP